VPVRRREIRPSQKTEESLGHTSCTISMCTTLPVWAMPHRGRLPGLLRLADCTPVAGPTSRGPPASVTIDEIKHWLGVFAWRFFQISQFKRPVSPMPPKLAQAARSPHEAITAPPAMRKQRLGRAGQAYPDHRVIPSPLATCQHTLARWCSGFAQPVVEPPVGTMSSSPCWVTLASNAEIVAGD